jgi:hypothetical protein
VLENGRGSETRFDRQKLSLNQGELPEVTLSASKREVNLKAKSISLVSDLLQAHIAKKGRPGTIMVGRVDSTQLYEAMAFRSLIVTSWASELSMAGMDRVFTKGPISSTMLRPGEGAGLELNFFPAIQEPRRPRPPRFPLEL